MERGREISLVKDQNKPLPYNESHDCLKSILAVIFERSTQSSLSEKLVVKIMTMLYLFVSLFTSQLLLVTPCAITEKEKVEHREETEVLDVYKTILESPDPKTGEAPWTNVNFTLGKGQHDVDTCRKVGMYVSFQSLGLSDKIIAPGGFSAHFCKGKCSSSQRKSFPIARLSWPCQRKRKELKLMMMRHAVSQPNLGRYQFSFLMEMTISSFRSLMTWSLKNADVSRSPRI